MSTKLIQELLQTRLTNITSPLPTAWENSKFESTANQPWQQVSFLPNDSDNPTIGTSDLTYESGIMQINLFYPKYSGSFASASKIDSIKALFPRGLLLESGQTRVRIENTPSGGVGFSDGEWWVRPVTIPYHAHVRG